MADKAEIKPKVLAYIESKRNEIVGTLRELVRIPSVTGGEGEAQKYMQRLYSGMGLKVTSQEADYARIRHHEAFVKSDFDYRGRPNIIGVMAGKPSAKSLLLNGHIDVVSPEPVAEWEFSPWEGKAVGNRLYGRGACDMKAGLIASYFALKALLESSVKPEGMVILQSVIEEEPLGGGGTLACLLDGYTADGMVIPEPNMKIVIAHPGVLFFKVKVTGRSAHAGMAHTGVNAIGKMNRVYEALVRLDERRARENHHPLFEKQSGRSCHLNIGTYQAGDWISTVAGWAELDCRLSYLPAETADEVKQQVAQAIKKTADDDQWLSQHPPEIIWYERRAEAWEQKPEDPFVQAFKSTADSTLGSDTEIVGATWGMDTRLAPYFNMPAISFGPNGGNIHGVNEYVDINSVIDCTKVLAAFIVDWCGAQKI
ncbi:MAG: ArgE/DapE family deacylase [Chloroflexi bacterium]|nr:ArgE/DapE family deacylase [Chloroflexota bacterium]